MSEDAQRPAEWTSYRTQCGLGRITYHYDWSPSRPWASYWLGTAGRHFTTPGEAAWYFRITHGTKLLID